MCEKKRENQNQTAYKGLQSNPNIIYVKDWES